MLMHIRNLNLNNNNLSGPIPQQFLDSNFSSCNLGNLCSTNVSNCICGQSPSTFIPLTSTIMVPTNPPPNSIGDSSPALTMGQIAGIAAGVAIIIALAVFFLVVRRRQKRSNQHEPVIVVTGPTQDTISNTLERQ